MEIDGDIQSTCEEGGVSLGQVIVGRSVMGASIHSDDCTLECNINQWDLMD